MNATTRKELQAHLNTIREAWALLDTAKDSIEALAEAERDKYGNLPEGLQGTAKGEQLEQAAEDLEELTSYLNDAIAGADDAIRMLEDTASFAA